MGICTKRTIWPKLKQLQMGQILHGSVGVPCCLNIWCWLGRLSVWLWPDLSLNLPSWSFTPLSLLSRSLKLWQATEGVSVDWVKDHPCRKSSKLLAVWFSSLLYCINATYLLSSLTPISCLTFGHASFMDGPLVEWAERARWGDQFTHLLPPSFVPQSPENSGISKREHGGMLREASWEGTLKVSHSEFMSESCNEEWVSHRMIFI